MLRLLGALFRSQTLRNASAKLLTERCGVHLGPMGQQLLSVECKIVSSQGGNSHDVAARVLAALIEEASVYGLDGDAQLGIARWSERIAKDVVLPDTAPRSRAAVSKAKRAANTAADFGRWKP